MPNKLFMLALPIGMALLTPIASPAARAADASQAAAGNYEQLAAQAEGRIGDPEFDYRLGIAALDAGRYGEAVIALQRVLAVQPNNAPARAELARAYALAGDIDTARAEFATVVDDPSLPDPVRQRFTGFVRQFDKQISGGGSDVSGFFDVRAGYDDNINAATDLNSIVIPLFSFLGPGTLGAGAVAQADEFYEVQGGVSAVTAIGRQDRLFASALGNWRDNFGSRRFDQAAVTGTAGYAHSFANRDVVSLSGQVQRFWFGHDGYRTSYGVIGQYTKTLDRGRALTLSAQWNRLDFDVDPLRDADRYALGVGYVTQNVVANLTGGKEETRHQAGDAQSNWFMGANVGGEFLVAPRVALVAGAAFDLRRYDQADALFLVERKDERLDLTAGVKVALTDHLFLQPRASWSRNWSNIALYDFERWTASVGLRFEF
ncbi:tetratricopeptide repeat protein [Sphingopyxis panaciterrulae]|jgi:Flp pilus assembly protein TadD, contains TPR repeats|uniref:Tetratricopeptide (TPR) repeat protein n=1 Tax=Sphingopyxis panaciterrulae TaxID=462372 RepID=A0A7W9ERL1_9SPHN|nr:tetratricopeptide repeat protein [Sphingopyxis panaciterrulae]MBB5706290.1 tetratricopeptide (TPR) repeat protein [Sphingopyxis panaciterrulae]